MLTTVSLLKLCWRDIADALEQATDVGPVNPLQGGLFDKIQSVVVKLDWRPR